MKKLLIISMLVFHSTFGKGNAIEVGTLISELHFDSLQNWSLELGFFMTPVPDSICIVSQSGSSQVVQFSIINVPPHSHFDSLIVLTNANLDTPLFINPLGDLIKIKVYFLQFGWYESHHLAFGTHPNSKLTCQKTGESIHYISGGGFETFAINKFPSIGLPNSNTGSYSSLSGRLCFTDSTVLPNAYLNLLDNWGALRVIASLPVTDSNGYFNGNILARSYSSNAMINWYEKPGIWYSLMLPYFTQCFRPDTTYDAGFIYTNIVSGINKHGGAFDNIVTVSPNPFNEQVVFFFRKLKENPFDDITLTITTISGEVLHQASMGGDTQTYTWNPLHTVPSGILLYQLSKNGQALQSGKMVKI